MLRRLLALGLFVGSSTAIALGCAAGADTNEDCPIGSEKCSCTEGGSCDAGLVCLSEICVDPDGGGSGPGPGSGAGGPGSGAGGPGSGGAPGTGGGFNAGGAGPECETGCNKIDVLFALDGSGSMAEEIGALAASQAFAAVTDALAAVNCGDIEYRIAVTDDNDGGFIVPNGWPGSNPWFDSIELDADTLRQAFSGAANQVIAGSGTEAGCEHVLSSSVSLLQSDASGFVRDDALLVLILVTDVDDYGAYDNVNGNDCGLGCTVTGQPVQNLYDTLVSLKGGDPKGVAAIVVAGDPNILQGQNFCGQPGVCGCNGLDCSVFHATRLWQFASLQTGMNGSTSNLCAGPQSVPTAVQTAFEGNIDLACKGFEPPQ